MAIPDLPPESRTWTFARVEIRAARPQEPVVYVRAAPRGEKPEAEGVDEPPPRYDVDHHVFARQIVVATSSTSITPEAKIGGITLVFRQVPSGHGLPYTFVFFGSPGSATSMSTGEPLQPFRLA